MDGNPDSQFINKKENVEGIIIWEKDGKLKAALSRGLKGKIKLKF